MKKISILVFLFILLLNEYQTFACTSFIISGKYTADGKPILFKNRDTDEMQNSLMYFNDGKFKYIGLVNGNEDFKTMVWGGYNEAGFAIINTAAYNNNIGDTTSFQDQEGVVMKLALQSCQSLDDFEKLLNSLPKPLGVDANFGVIDAYGGAAYYETGNYKFTKFDANDANLAPNGILVRTNHSMSADLTKGYGFNRYNTAFAALNKAAIEKKLNPQYLFSIISRNLYHTLTKTDLSADIPALRDVPDFKFFIDYIPRESTASAIMIVGAKDKSQLNQLMAWTIIGFPLTSVAIPTWIAAGDKLPKAVNMDKKLNSPICKAALKFKSEAFPITYDKGYNYINLSVLLNKQNTGYMQLLQPIENDIFNKTNDFTNALAKGSKTVADIPAFYSSLDDYLAQKYKEVFNYSLF